MDLLIEKRKFLQNYRTNTDFIEGIEVNTDDNSMTIKNNLLNSSTNTTKVFLGIPHLKYDATTNRIVAGKAVETTLNSLYLRDQHKMSSGAENIFFTNRNSEINFFPAWQGIRDQSEIVNRNVDGILKPTARTYSDNVVGIERFANAIEASSTPFDTTSTYEANLSAYGIEFVLSEDVTEDMYLIFNNTINDRQIYSQKFTSNHNKGESILLWFTHPLEAHSGTTVTSSFKKYRHSDDSEIGTLLIERAENLDGDGEIKPYVKIYVRTFEDKEIALGDSVKAKYLGIWDPSTNTPDIDTLDANNEDFFYIQTEGVYNGVTYSKNDKIVFNSLLNSWDHRIYELTTINNMTNFDEYNIFVDSDSTSEDPPDGSALNPYTNIDNAIINSNPGDRILVKGENIITSSIILPHSLYFYGTNGGSKIKYVNFDVSNENIMFHSGDYTHSFLFENITFENAGEYAINCVKSKSIEIKNCIFQNNGWNGDSLNTNVSTNVSGILGYDSDKTSLETFGASTNISSDSGAILIKDSSVLKIIGNIVVNNSSGIYIIDCGQNGNGFITRNIIKSNILSGIYLGSAEKHGNENIIATINSISSNSNAGIVSISGLNNKFSQNDIIDNWNSAMILYAPTNITIRDSNLFNNNKSLFDGAGNDAISSASIEIVGDFQENLTTISFKPDYQYLVELLDIQINSQKDGVHFSENLGDLSEKSENVIRLDDIRFTNNNCGINFEDCDISSLNVSLSDNSFQNVTDKNIKLPEDGMYNELPFSNHIMNVKNLNILTDTLRKTITLVDGDNSETENVINIYKINELQSVRRDDSTIDIIQKNSNKIQLKDVKLGHVYLNSSASPIGSNTFSLNDTLNSIFSMNLTEFKSFLESTVNITIPERAIYFFIESPDNVFSYPLFKNSIEASNFDISEGGSGLFHTKTFIDDLSGTTYYIPDTSYVSNDVSRPVDGVYSNTNSVVWNEIKTGPDSDYIFETIIGDSTYNLFYIEDSSGNFFYPLLKNGADAADLDSRMDGNGNAVIKTFDEDYSGITWYAPQNFFVDDANSAPQNGIWIYNPFLNTSFSNVFWNKHNLIQESEIGSGNNNQTATFFYIESPDGTFHYPLFRTETEAVNVDAIEGGSGNFLTKTFVDDISGTTWYVPVTNYTDDGTEAPNNGNWGNISNVLWNVQNTGDDSNFHFPSEIGNGSQATFYYIESPDNSFNFPIFKSPFEAANFDSNEGGPGSSIPITFTDDISGLQWYRPLNSYISNGLTAPSNGIYGNSPNVLWYEQPTYDDSNYVPTFTDFTVSVIEGQPVNLQYRPMGDTHIYSISNYPTYLVDDGIFSLTGTAEEITDGEDVEYNINITKANQFGSTSGIITLKIVNLPGNDDTQQTPWTKMIAFDGSSDHLKPHTGSDVFSIFRRENEVGSDTVASGKTALIGYPWLMTFVLKRLDSSAERGIFSFRNGTGAGKEGIYVKFKSNKLHFRYGNGYNNVEFKSDTGAIPVNEWCGIYIEYNGGKTGNASDKLNDYYSRFRFKILRSNGNLPGNLDGTFEDISGTWHHSNYGFNSTFSTKVLSIGSVHSTSKSFGGYIAAHIQSTLRTNQFLPADDEIKMILNDPIKWVDTYKEGEPFRKTGQTVDNNIFFDKTQYDPNISTRLYLMGEVNTENAAVSYSYPRIPNWFVGQERLLLTNMSSNDILNIF